MDWVASWAKGFVLAQNGRLGVVQTVQRLSAATIAKPAVLRPIVAGIGCHAGVREPGLSRGGAAHPSHGGVPTMRGVRGVLVAGQAARSTGDCAALARRRLPIR